MKTYKYAAFILLILLASCSSNVADEFTDVFGILPTETTVYVSLDYESEPDLSLFFLGEYMELDSNSKQVLDRTDRIFIGIYSRSKEQLEFNLLGSGKYPKSAINFGLCTDGRWKKGIFEYTYWTHNLNGLQLSIPGKDLAFVSSSSITSMLDNLVGKRKSGFVRDRKEILEKSLLSVYIPEANLDYISTVGLGDTTIDLNYFLFTVNKNDDLYHVSGEISLHTARDASAFKVGFKTYLLGTIRQFGRDVTKKFTGESSVENKENKVFFSDINLEFENLKVFIADMFFKKDKK